MPVDEVKPGMRGNGVTRLRRRDARRVPGRDPRHRCRTPSARAASLILARLSGHRLADTGVMQGMSGSPVYIDGRLIGAVSYSLGAFSKEPIAGITPIADMIDATNRTTGTPAPVRSAAAATCRWPAPPAEFAAALRDAFARDHRAPARRSRWPAPTRRSSPRCPTVRELRPIAVAYTMAGFSGDTRRGVHAARSAAGAPRHAAAAASRRRRRRRARRSRPATPSASA